MRVLYFYIFLFFFYILISNLQPETRNLQPAVYTLCSKTNISKFQFNLESVPNKCSVLNTLTPK